ncbi:MAG: hypothetical protein U0800_04325 [Isosphaeraceae bacterium]
MKCDQVFAALATGKTLDRWRANLHLRACTKCEAESVRLLEITRILAAAPPLSRAHRVLWMASSLEPKPTNHPAALPRRWAIGLAVALLLASIAWLLPHDNRITSEKARLPPLDVMLTEDPPSERELLAIEMLAKVDRLEGALDDLRRRADLLDARREADALWSRYARIDPTAF